MKLKLKDWQIETSDFILDHKRVLVASEMGTGKTACAIDVANEDVSIKNILIVCPATIKYKWQDEWYKWSYRKDLTIAVIETQFSNADVIIINYERVKTHIKQIRKRKWDMFIADESHYLKNDKAKRTRMLLHKNYGIKSEYAVFMTGTPILNRPSELWTTLNYLRPEKYNNRMSFYMRFCGAKYTYWGWDFSGATNLEVLNKELKFIMIRFTKDVLDLPPKIFNTIYLNPDNKVKKLLKQEHHQTTDGDPIAVIRRKLGISKIPFSIRHIKYLLDSGVNKLVVFCYHRAVIQALIEEFKDISVNIYGSTSARDRHNAVKYFTEKPEIKLCLCNIKSASLGIDLTVASHEFFIEFDWTPGYLLQAEDRCHRMGTYESLNIDYALYPGSFDDVLVRKMIDKQKIVRKILK